MQKRPLQQIGKAEGRTSGTQSAGGQKGKNTVAAVGPQFLSIPVRGPRPTAPSSQKAFPLWSKKRFLQSELIESDMALRFKLRFSEGGVPHRHLWIEEEEEGKGCEIQSAKMHLEFLIAQSGKKKNPTFLQADGARGAQNPARIWNSPKFVGTEAFCSRSCPSPWRPFLQPGSRLPKVRAAR